LLQLLGEPVPAEMEGSVFEAATAVSASTH
jgi:hypothetical protein